MTYRNQIKNTAVSSQINEQICTLVQHRWKSINIVVLSCFCIGDRWISLYFSSKPLNINEHRSTIVFFGLDIDENRWTFVRNRWNPMENDETSMNIDETRWNIGEHRRKTDDHRWNIGENPWTSAKILRSRYSEIFTCLIYFWII